MSDTRRPLSEHDLTRLLSGAISSTAQALGASRMLRDTDQFVDWLSEGSTHDTEPSTDLKAKPAEILAALLEAVWLDRVDDAFRAGQVLLARYLHDEQELMNSYVDQIAEEAA